MDLSSPGFIAVWSVIGSAVLTPFWVLLKERLSFGDRSISERIAKLESENDGLVANQRELQAKYEKVLIEFAALSTEVTFLRPQRDELLSRTRVLEETHVTDRVTIAKLSDRNRYLEEEVDELLIVLDRPQKYGKPKP